MAWLGTLSIYGALYACIVGLALNFAAGIRGSKRLVFSGRFAAVAACGFIFTASSVLFHALLTHDYSIAYVASFSDTSMPLFYLMGAMWGGQAGSLLFWVSIVAWCLCICLYVNRNKYEDFMPWVDDDPVRVCVRGVDS